ncbi:alpha/beta hydrolase [Thalassovita sp.]|uniref:alpha/beta fold hydrolase n=1 Tax=Thalassovita sp. TaxID=1979401 RepID=UPI0029DE752C|nr:alpha/beta hydrolase [Thalassovita sp.]
MISGTLAALACVGAAHGYTLHRAARHESRATAAYPPEGQFITVDGHRLHVVVHGQGPDLVLIHGASGNTRDFTHDLAQQLAARYRVIVFDRPGLGYSDRVNHGGATIRQQAHLMARAAAQLGANRPIVLGQSYGGAVALAWAVDCPENIAALVPLAAASQTWDGPLSRYYRTLSHRWIGPLVIPYLTAFVPDSKVQTELDSIFTPQQPPAGYDTHIGAGLTLRRAALRANALQRANLNEEVRALVPFYGQINVPTEILHGTADTIVGLEHHSVPLSRQIPAARLTVLPGVGHMPQHAAKPQVIAAIDRAAARAGLN